ncbi:MAG: hypothetical protein ABR553_04420 [Gammaproteobacteria bacterium]
MSTLPDFNDSELWTVRSALKERYGHDVEVQLAETEVRLSRHTTNMTPCPTLYWQAGDGCHFLVVKTGAERLPLPVLLPGPSDVRHRQSRIATTSPNAS